MKRKNKKKSFLVQTLSLLLVSVSVFFTYQSYIYNVDLNSKELKKDLTDWLNRGNGTSKVEVEEYQVEKFENEKAHLIYFILKDGQVGYAFLKEGTLGKMRFDLARYGTEKAKIVDLKELDNGKLYVIGTNPNYKIKNIAVNLPTIGELFVLQVPQKKLYLSVVEKPKQVKIISSLNLTYFDFNDKLLKEMH